MLPGSIAARDTATKTYEVLSACPGLEVEPGQTFSCWAWGETYSQVFGSPKVIVKTANLKEWVGKGWLKPIDLRKIAAPTVKVEAPVKAEATAPTE